MKSQGVPKSLHLGTFATRASKRCHKIGTPLWFALLFSSTYIFKKLIYMLMINILFENHYHFWLISSQLLYRELLNSSAEARKVKLRVTVKCSFLHWYVTKIIAIIFQTNLNKLLLPLIFFPHNFNYNRFGNRLRWRHIFVYIVDSTLKT